MTTCGARACTVQAAHVLAGSSTPSGSGRALSLMAWRYLCTLGRRAGRSGHYLASRAALTFYICGIQMCESVLHTQLVLLFHVCTVLMCNVSMNVSGENRLHSLSVSPKVVPVHHTTRASERNNTLNTRRHQRTQVHGHISYTHQKEKERGEFPVRDPYRLPVSVLSCNRLLHL